LKGSGGRGRGGPPPRPPSRRRPSGHKRRQAAGRNAQPEHDRYRSHSNNFDALGREFIQLRSRCCANEVAMSPPPWSCDSGADRNLNLGFQRLFWLVAITRYGDSVGRQVGISDARGVCRRRHPTQIFVGNLLRRAYRCMNMHWRANTE